MFLTRILVAAGEPCRRCDQLIAPGETVWDRAPYEYFNIDEKPLGPYHPACGVDVDAQEGLLALSRGIAAGEVPDNDPLVALAAARTKAIASARQYRADQRKGLAAKWPAIAPARDLKGRPRVQVVIAGSLISMLSTGRTTDSMTLAPDNTLRSALREYVLVEWVGRGRTTVDEDPSQPRVGAVFAVHAGTRLVKAQVDKLAQWHIQGYAVPVIWVAQASVLSPAEVDVLVLKLREALESVGYCGDDAHVLLTPTISSESLTLLGETLDIAITDLDSVLVTGKPRERACELLQQALDEGRVETLDRHLRRISSGLQSAAAAERAACATLASKALHHAPARLTALSTIAFATGKSGKYVDVEAVRAALRASLAARTKGDGISATVALRLLTLAKCNERFADVIAALDTERSATKRFSWLLEQLSDCRDPASIALARAWLSGLKRSDPRLAVASGRIELVEEASKIADKTRLAGSAPVSSA
ncbi:MAG: hypothetical protein Q8Q09_10760 [Deltaproteobacteria bacterium]|nr:hypothetical protein [Deltaproteobacteria bacterium]